MAEDALDFDLLKIAVKQQLNFDCSFYTNAFLQRRFEVRMRYVGTKSYSEYMKFLEVSIGERELLLKELTIHTTNFFRDKPMWELFQKEIIPLVVKNKEKEKENNNLYNRVIRVWSIGCSSGEEPISVAICFFEALGENLGGFNISILATDLDSETIKKAIDAKYELPQFKEMPLAIREKYFSENLGYYEPVLKIKNLISYRQNDIFLPNKPKGYDIILCRNTVIYFNQEPKLKVYEELYDCLQTNGFFIMGKTETMVGPARNKFIQFSLKERVFCKDYENTQSQDDF